MDGTLSDKAKLIQYLLEAEALSPENGFMLGDRKYDMLAAAENGLFPIGALWGYGNREELVSAGALRLCETPSQVLKAICG